MSKSFKVFVREHQQLMEGDTWSVYVMFFDEQDNNREPGTIRLMKTPGSVPQDAYETVSDKQPTAVLTSEELVSLTQALVRECTAQGLMESVAATYKEQIRSLESDLAEEEQCHAKTQSNYIATNKELTNLKEEYDQLEKNYIATDKYCGELARGKADYRKALEATAGYNGELHAEVQELKKEVQELKEELLMVLAERNTLEEIVDKLIA